MTGNRLSLTFPGADSKPEINGLDALETKSNYYLGADPSKWLTNVPNYGKLRYHDLYRGIDLIFHGEHGGLEYDFVVGPGADPGKIRMKVEGASGQIRLSSGTVQIPMGSGKLHFARPEIFQLRNGRRESVRGNFVLLGPKTLGFHIDSYDRALPLVIDPTLSYATFLSGSQESPPVGVAVDPAGEIYVAGSTMATDFPTAAPFQAKNGGYENAFLSKISTSGTSLVFSTYIGGNGFDTGAGLALDSQNDAYLLGNTGSANFPTTSGSFRTACPSLPACSAPFVSKFSPTGSLIFSTLLSVGANGKAIAVDRLGNAYVTGAIDFPGLDLVNPFEPQYQGIVSTSTGDGFVQELNSSGTALVYSTYLAGVPGTDGLVNTIGLGIAVDANGSAYVTGNSSPANFPTRNTSLTLNAGNGVFVVKFKPDGSDLVFSASISGNATAAGIALDPLNNVYLTGTAGSADFPVTPGAFQSACSPVGSALCQNPQIFALEMSADGSSLLYSTLLGSGYPGGIAVDSSGRAYLTGTTAQSNFPTVNPIQAALQTSPGISQDAYVTALDPTGIPFFSTFLGGALTVDAGTAIAVDPAGNDIYVVGTTGNGDFPLVHPGQDVTGGGDSAFVATIDVAASGPALSVTPRWDPFLYVRNVSSAPLHISSFASSDPTPLAGDCIPAHALAPGTFCTLVAGGVLSHKAEPYFTLTVTSDAPGSPNQFRIYEDTIFSQVRDAPLLVTSATALYFGYQLTGTASAPQTFTLTNIGQASSTINSITADTSALLVTNTCPAILGANASCTIQVVFAPTTLNTLGGIVSISHELPNQRIDLGAGGLPMTNALQASTQSIQFGSQFVGITYQSRTVVLTNISSSPIVLNSFTPSSDYSQTNNCPNPLPPGASCRVFVSFAPVGNGEIQGTLTVEHNAAGGQVTVQLYGVGLIRSDLSVSPLQLIFPGSALIGSIDGPQSVTLQNTSTSSLSVSSISIAPSVFTIAPNTCVGPLAPAASCTLKVSFTPASVGPVSGTLTIAHTGVGSPQIISVSGSGTTQLTLGGEVNFGDQEVGTTGGWHYVDASNLSYSTSVTVSSVSVTGDFQIAQGAPGTIPPGYGTAYQVTFTPTAPGLRTGTFTVIASDSSSPHQITLTGNGVSAGVEVAPGSLAFGNLFAGTTSGPQTVTLTNVSGNPVHFQSISATGPFSETNSCGTSLAVGANCAVLVTFSPMILGDVSGQIMIQDDASGSPQAINMSGTGTGTAVKVSPTNVIFANQAMGYASPSINVSLTNQAGTALSISTISASGDFGQTSGCGASLAPGGSCSIGVTFTPTAVGLRSGTLSISDSGPNSPQSVTLSGIGTPPPSVSLSPTRLDFGGVLVNQSALQNLSITPSNAPLTLQGFDFSSALFHQQNGCIPSVASGVSCQVFVFFQPTGLGSVTGTMAIRDDASNAPQSIQLTGSGTHFTLQPASGNGQVITAGQPASFNFSMNSLSGLSETILLSCSGVPAQATCNLSQPSATLTGNPQLLSVTVMTTKHSSSSPILSADPRPLSPTWSNIFVMLWLLLGFSALLRAPRIHVGPRQVVPLVVVISLAMALLSCAGGGSGTAPTSPPSSQTGTPAGVYAITVTGTSSNPANPAQAVQLPFTVN